MTKAMMTVLPVAMFVSSGFEHCVANMFMVPLGIPDSNVTLRKFLDANWRNTSPVRRPKHHKIYATNLVPVTIGNIVGGSVLVGLANWSIYKSPTT
ncbi:formate/nitrite transporter family protein [Vibrio lentus]|nr:formate/nitrite transporter family protein [Vibrio lentus]